MNKQNVGSSHNEKEWSTDPCYNPDELENIMLSERSQSQKASYYMTLFMLNVYNKQIHRDTK